MNSFMLENAMREEKQMLIDLGYATEKKTWKAHDALRDFGIGAKRFQVFWFGNGRLMLSPPKSKIQAIMEKFPIKEGTKYWQSTHFFDYDSWTQAAKEAIK